MQFTMNIRKSAELYKNLLQHRHNSVITLQAVKQNKLQKRISSVAGEPPLNRLTQMIIEAYRERKYKLSCLELHYQEGLLRLKNKTTVMHRLENPVSEDYEKPLRYQEDDQMRKEFYR